MIDWLSFCMLHSKEPFQHTNIHTKYVLLNICSFIWAIYLYISFEESFNRIRKKFSVYYYYFVVLLRSYLLCLEHKLEVKSKVISLCSFLQIAFLSFTTKALSFWVYILVKTLLKWEFITYLYCVHEDGERYLYTPIYILFCITIFHTQNPSVLFFFYSGVCRILKYMNCRKKIHLLIIFSLLFLRLVEVHKEQ